MLLGRNIVSDFNHRVLSMFDSAGHHEHDGDDEAVKGEGLGEDHHENEGNKDILLTVGTYTGITNNANSQTCSEG